MKTWCEPLKMVDGSYVYGGAARNVRIANFGGMPAILNRMFEEASNLAKPAPEVRKKATVHQLSTKLKKRA